jgi:hypothetical protein
MTIQGIKQIASVTFILLCAMGISAQHKSDSTKSKSKAVFNIEFLASTDFDALYISYIGPGFHYSKGQITASINLFPGVRFVNTLQNNCKNKLQASPEIAIGPLVKYKRILLGVPFFYLPFDKRWHITAGLGYVIVK